jgi:hypothetical protein
MWILVAIFSTEALARSPGNYTQLRFELQKVTQKDLVTTLNNFIKASAPSRMVGQAGHEKSRAFILQQLKSLDPKGSGKIIEDSFDPDIQEAKRFYQKDFDQQITGKFPTHHPEYKKWFNFTQHMQEEAQKLKSLKGKNIIWEKTGLDSSKLLVVTAHYDTISHDKETLLINNKEAMPGANYNASGVSVALRMIQILAAMDLNYSVQVVFLDWQGVGFLGSFHHARELKKSSKNILGFLNLEMLGQDTSFFDKTKKTGNMAVYYRPEDEAFIQRLTTHGKKITQKVDFELHPKGFENSDNIRFWDQGFRGGTFTQNWEVDFNPKFYQTPQDTSETLNHTTLYQGHLYITGAVASFLLDLTK